MIQIALYGKGGIGKSTVSANLSAALAGAGKKVLQIGCDPKHDSTRLLMGGKSIPTVLDYIRRTPPEAQELEALLFKGYGGTVCVETGGPKPGIGCAGRGILSGFEALARLGIRKIPFDVILYDVLGDVVCGGFAVPLRKEYADVVFLVTSGEYMALYAANNILRGISNFEDVEPRVAGIILNKRGLSNEVESVAVFAEAVGLPIVASIPRREEFAEAEKAGMTLAELVPESEISEIFRKLASYVEKIEKNRGLLHHAKPLEDLELETLVLGVKNRGPAEHFSSGRKPAGGNNKRPAGNMGKLGESLKEENPGPEKCTKKLAGKFLKVGSTPAKPETRASEPFKRSPLYGCAFSGAVCATFQMRDAATIMHGPRSCAHISSDALASSFLRRGDSGDSNAGNLPCLLSTDMEEEDLIFGGLGKLKAKIEEALAGGRNTIFIVSSCPAGIIGDDIRQAAFEMETRNPGALIIPLPVDGVQAGDFSAGFFEGCRALAELIDQSIKAEKRLVNIIGERSFSPVDGENFRTIEELLNKLGYRVNSRFLNGNSLEGLRSFKKAELTLPANTDSDTWRVQAYLSEKFGFEFFDLPFPVGFRESEHWLKALGKRLNGAEALTLLKEETEKYRAEIEKYRPLLAGKRVLLVSYGQNLGWVLDTIRDLGMEIVKVGVPPSAFGKREVVDLLGLAGLSNLAGKLKENYTDEKRIRDIKALKPDLVLSGYAPLIPTEGVHCDTLPFSPKVGFLSGIELAKRWSTLLRLPVAEGWKFDGEDY